MIDRDTIEDIAHRLKTWVNAYPEVIFKPLSHDEVQTVAKVFPGVLDRQAAAMGRHIVAQIVGMGEDLERALGPDEDDDRGADNRGVGADG